MPSGTHRAVHSGPPRAGPSITHRSTHRKVSRPYVGGNGQVYVYHVCGSRLSRAGTVTYRARGRSAARPASPRDPGAISRKFCRYGGDAQRCVVTAARTRDRAANQHRIPPIPVWVVARRAKRVVGVGPPAPGCRSISYASARDGAPTLASLSALRSDARSRDRCFRALCHANKNARALRSSRHASRAAWREYSPRPPSLTCEESASLAIPSAMVDCRARCVAIARTSAALAACARR